MTRVETQTQRKQDTLKNKKNLWKYENKTAVKPATGFQ
jgi:hypothetical protein